MIFEFETPDGQVIEIEAPSQEAALKAFQNQTRISRDFASNPESKVFASRAASGAPTVEAADAMIEQQGRDVAKVGLPLAANLALGAATGGMSLPAQMAIQGTGAAGIGAVGREVAGEEQTAGQAALDAFFGAAGPPVGKAVGAGAKWLKEALHKGAVKDITQLTKTPVQHQAQVQKGVEEAIAANAIPKGNAAKLAAATANRADELYEPVKAHQTRMANEPKSGQDIRDQLSQKIVKEMSFPPETGAAVKHDEALINSLSPHFQKIKELQELYGDRIPTGVLEKELSALSLAYRRASAATPGSDLETMKNVGDMYRRFLNEADPGRAAVTGPYSRAQGLAESLSDLPASEYFKSGGHIGEAGALRAGAGMMMGGPVSSAVASGGVPLLSPMLRSAGYRTRSSAAKEGAARALNPDVLATAARGGTAALSAIDEIIEMLRAGDRGGARQVALQHKRETGERLDTRALEAALYAEEPQ